MSLIELFSTTDIITTEMQKLLQTKSNVDSEIIFQLNFIKLSIDERKAMLDLYIKELKLLDDKTKEKVSLSEAYIRCLNSKYEYAQILLDDMRIKFYDSIIK